MAIALYVTASNSMLGSWRLPSKPDERNTSHTSPRKSMDARSHSPHKPDVDDTSSTRSSLDRALTAALSTPHDAVLAELLGHRVSEDPQQASTRPGRPRLTTAASAGSVERSEQTASTSAQALRSSATSPSSAAPELVYDPFSGTLVGVMMSPMSDRSRERDASGTDFDLTRDELWSHLARIRGLQSDIAGMHLQMEGVGSSEARGAKRAPGAAGRATGGPARSTTEEWEDPEDERKAARDAEFANLTETFNSRRTAIDGIMNKLDDLSKALSTFHALPTPVMDFSNSRNPTKDSTAMSPTSPGSTSVDTVAPHPDQHEFAFRDSPTSDAPSHPGFS